MTIKLSKKSSHYLKVSYLLFVLKYAVLCNEEEKIAIEVVKYGATQTLVDDLRKHTRGVNILSAYLHELLEFIASVVKHG